MEKRKSRFDRLREEKKKNPYLFGEGTPPGADNPSGSSEKSYNALAKVIRMMLTQDRKKG